jgi:hypothetical protein
MRRRVGSILLLLQLLAVGVRAQPAPDAEADALAHLEAGIAAYRAGDYSTAYREFTAASTGAPDKPNPYRWLARTEGKLGDCAGVRVHVREFLARVPAGDPRAPEMIQLRVACDHAAAPVDPTVGSPSRPLVRRWWFWTAVIGGAAVIAGAVVLATRSDGPNELPPIQCNASGCAP